MLSTPADSERFHPFRTLPSVFQSSRLSVYRGDRISTSEVAILLACGALAAAAVGLLQLRIAVPGHAILRAVLPMALGAALVPRRGAGLVMAAGAGIGCGLMSVAQVGAFPAAAMLSALALGPVLDIALRGNPLGWKLYARFATAGAAANLLAYFVKLGTLQLGWSAAGGRQFLAFGMLAPVSFIVCGTIAGLISATIFFRLRVTDDLRRN